MSVRRTRRQVFTDRLLAILAGAVLVSLLAGWGWLFATTYADDQRRADCTPVDYHTHAWWNAAGQQVAVALSEDSPIVPIGHCS